MKVKYQQRNNYGCISFALANIFDDHRFLEDLPMGGPVRMADMRSKMVDFLPEIFIQETFLTSHKLPCGNRLQVCQRDILRPIEDDEVFVVSRETIVIPFILTIINESGNQHAVAFIWDIGNDKYHWINSTNDLIHVGELDHFIEFYHIVGVAQFSAWGCGDNGLMMQKDELPHIFDPVE